MQQFDIEKLMNDIRSGKKTATYDKDGIKYTVTVADEDTKKYLVYTSFDDEDDVRKKYVEWVKRSRDVSKSFKNKIDSKKITVTKIWREFHLFNCKNEIEFLLNDNSFNTIKFVNQETVPVGWGRAPTKNQSKSLKLALSGAILSTMSLDVSEQEREIIERAETRKINVHTECLDYCKREFSKGLDATGQVMLENAVRISKIEILKETVIIYPEFVISVKDGFKTYGGVWERDYLDVPDFAPPSRTFKRWKWASKLCRAANFVIFLASMAMAIGLLIVSDSKASSNPGAGLPMILCGFWMFPINIIGVILPFFLIDNYAIDIYDFKEKSRFYLIYNLIYLALAFVFVGVGHIVAHFIW